MSRLHIAKYWLVTLLLLGAVTAAAVASESTARNEQVAAELPMADRIQVNKSQRKLFLLRDGAVLREFNIRLGLRPEGHKEVEGDFRTPEGHYFLTERNPNSKFFLSVQISYPNQRDLEHAQRLKQRPGGLIMIHGLPNQPTRALDYYQTVDWTDGCIAISNADMVELWLMTRGGIPIDIYP